jgi:hypothetical protein
MFMASSVYLHSIFWLFYRCHKGKDRCARPSVSPGRSGCRHRRVAGHRSIWFPIVCDLDQRRHYGIDASGSIALFLGDRNAVFGPQTHEWREPGRLSNGEQAPRALVELETAEETVCPFGGAVVWAAHEDGLELAGSVPKASTTAL